MALPSDSGYGGVRQKKKKKKPVRTYTPARITNLDHFHVIAEKSQKGKSLNLNDLQYMQRLAWTAKGGGEPKDLRLAIEVARKWIEGLKSHTIGLPTKQGEVVQVPHMGLAYTPFHDENKIAPNKQYQSVLDSYVSSGKSNDIFESLMHAPLQEADRMAAQTTATEAFNKAQGQQLQEAKNKAFLDAAEQSVPGTTPTWVTETPTQETPPKGTVLNYVKAALSAPAGPATGRMVGTASVPATPADQPVKDIALGHWQAGGTLPSPQQMVDLLGAALMLKDIDPKSTSTSPPGESAWEEYFRSASMFKNPVPPPDTDIPMDPEAVSLMAKQNEMPVVKLPPATGRMTGSSPVGGPGFNESLQSYISGKPVDNTTYTSRTLDWFLSPERTPEEKKIIMDAIEARGFQVSKDEPLGTVAAMPYHNLVHQFVYAQNVSDAAWGTPDEQGAANKLMSQTDVQNQGYSLNKLASAMGGRGTDNFKNFVYYTAMPARPVNISESGYLLWYGHKYGRDSLPSDLQVLDDNKSGNSIYKDVVTGPSLLAQAAWKFMQDSVPLGDVVTESLSQTGRGVKEAFSGISAADRAVTRNRYTGWFYTDTKGGVSGIVGAANTAVQYPIQVVNRLVVAMQFFKMMETHPNWKPGDAVAVDKTLHGGEMVSGPITEMVSDVITNWNGWSSLVETGAKAWHESEGRKIWYETLSAAGVDPAKHEAVAFWGQMAVDTGLAIALQSALGSAISVGAKSQTIQGLLEDFNVRSHYEILGDMKDPVRIRELYNIDVSAAEKLAATDGYEGVQRLVREDPNFAVKYFDPGFDFSSRSVAKRLQIAVLKNGRLPSWYRALTVPLPGPTINCVSDSDLQVINIMRIVAEGGGNNMDEAYRFANNVLKVRSKYVDFPDQAVRNMLAHPTTGFDALVKRTLDRYKASPEFTAANVGKDVTAYDECLAFIRKLRGMDEGEWGDAVTPRVAYAPSGLAMSGDDVETLTNDIREGSLKIAGPEVDAAKKAIFEETNRTKANLKTIKTLDATINDSSSVPELVQEANLAKTKLLRENVRLAKERENAVRQIPREAGFMGQPTAATEAQFGKVFTPFIRPDELAIFKGGKAMQNWALMQKALKMDKVNSTFKRMWLSRMATMMTIVGSDEALRSVVSGINPLGGLKGLKNLPGFRGTLSEDAAFAVMQDPHAVEDIFDLMDIGKVKSWDIVSPWGGDHAGWEAGVRQTLATRSAASPSILIKDWLEAYDAALSDLRFAEVENVRLPKTPPKVGEELPAEVRPLAEIEAELHKTWSDLNHPAETRTPSGIVTSPAYTGNEFGPNVSSSAMDRIPQGSRLNTARENYIKNPNAETFEVARKANIEWHKKVLSNTKTRVDRAQKQFDSLPSEKQSLVRGNLDSMREKIALDEKTLRDAEEIKHPSQESPRIPTPETATPSTTTVGQGPAETAASSVLQQRILALEQELADHPSNKPVPFEKLGTPTTESVPKTDAELRALATKDADKVIHENLRTDVRYIGGTDDFGNLHQGLLPLRDPNAYEPLLVKHAPELKEEFLNYFEASELDWIHRLNGNSITRRHLEFGPSAIQKGDLAGADVRNAYGVVQYAVEHPKGIKGSLYHPVGLAVRASDGTLNVLTKMATQLKKQNFGHYFNERFAVLEPFTDMTYLEKIAVARRYALARTDELSYLSGRTLIEENVRNLVMFLPAYRQFLLWWGKRFMTHPFTTSMLMRALGSVGPQRIPQNVPVLGGLAWNPQTVNFFASFTPGSTQRWTPPFAPTVTIPFEWGALSGNPAATKVYSLLSGGYQPAGPQMRWADSLLMGAYSMAFGQVFPWGSVSQALHIPLPGTTALEKRRTKAVLAELVVQSIQGKPIDVKAAARTVGLHEAAKGAVSWGVPGTWMTALPVVTIQIDPYDTGTKTPMKLDLARITQAQYLYLQAVTDAEKNAVIDQYPEYAPIAYAWTLDGEKQLDFLSHNRWIIPLVSQRNISNTGAVGVTPATPAEFKELKTVLSPQAVADAMKLRFDQIDRYVLAKKYEKAKAQWDADFKAKYKGWTGQAKARTTNPKQPYLSMFYNPLIANFYKNNKSEIDRLVLDTNGQPMGLQLTDKKQKDHPVFSYAYPTKLVIDAGTTLSPNTFDGMKRLEDSGLLYGKLLVRDSPMYQQYVKMRKQDDAATMVKFMAVAMKPYKSDVDANDWIDFIGMPYNTLAQRKRANAAAEKMLVFEQHIDELGKAYKSLPFASKEYKKGYYALKDYIETQRKSNPLLAPYIGATAPELLAMGPYRVDVPRFIDGNEKTMKEWESLKPQIIRGDMTAKQLHSIKLKASPALVRNWDVAVAAWSWHYALTVANMARHALLSNNNPLGWYKGYTVESTYGQVIQKWTYRALRRWIDPKHHLSEMFYAQWQLADKASEYNLIYDLCDTSK